jgi:multidrug efflux system outer membrane protein
MTGQRTARPARLAGPALAAGLAACLVSACAPDTAYRPPGFAFAPAYRGAAGARPLLQNAEWWTRFRDPVLDRLVALALAESPDLEEARARALAAEAELRAVPGAFSLSPSLRAGLETSDGSGPETAGEASLGLSWLLDPSGSRRATLRIAASERDIAAAEADSARLVVLMNLASAYLSLRHAQTTLALSRAEEERRRATLALTRQLGEGGQTSELELLRARARLAEVQADLPGLEAAIPARLGEIAVLAGRAPGALPPDLTALLQSGMTQPQAALAGNVGIPADLLRNRPDIRIAERGYYAAIARIGSARAALYPRLSLTGSISHDLASGSTERFFGPSLSLPVLPAETARAGVEAAAARAEAAHAAWKARVLSALLEVETALGDYAAANRALGAAADAARLHGRVLNLTRRLFQEGEATLSDLITAEEEAAAAAQRLADLRLAQGQSFVKLNTQLGSIPVAPETPPETPAGPVAAAGQ